MRAMLLVLSLLLAGSPALAFATGEALSDPAAESRARSLFHELRCMVCQNQSIADSDAPLAQDLRALVRERIEAGDNEAEIKTFLVARYGEFVLLRPPMEPSTWLLWGAPLIVLLCGGAASLLALRRRSAPPGALSADEERRLEEALKREG